MSLVSSEQLAGIKIRLALIMLSAVLWAGFWFLNSWLLSDLDYATGISLIYFPAGVRLLIVLVFGVWGALGIALSNPLLFIHAFGQQSIVELLLNSLIAGFVPLFVARACQRILGIGQSLENLRAVHLPLIALAVSIVTPLAFNLMFSVYELKPFASLAQNISAMALGDFLGCMFTLIIAKIGLSVMRRMGVIKRAA